MLSQFSGGSRVGRTNVLNGMSTENVDYTEEIER